MPGIEFKGRSKIANYRHGGRIKKQLGGAQLGGAQLGGAEGNTRPITGTQRFDQPGMGMRGGLMYNKGGRVGLKKGTKKTYQERLEPSGNSFKDAFSSAKKAGKKEFTWKGRDYTTVTKAERKASFKRESKRDIYKGKTSQGKQGGLTEFEGAFKTAKNRFGPHKVFKHKGKEFMSDVKGDKPRREGYDTQVIASKGGRVGLEKGKLVGMRTEAQKKADEKLVAAKKWERRKATPPVRLSEPYKKTRS